MKRIKSISCFMMLLIVCISCSEKYDDNKYFNGDIRKIEDNSGVVRKIALKKVYQVNLKLNQVLTFTV